MTTCGGRGYFLRGFISGNRDDSVVRSGLCGVTRALRTQTHGLRLLADGGQRARV